MGTLLRAAPPNEAARGEEASINPVEGWSRPELSDMYEPGDAAAATTASSFGSTDGGLPADDGSDRKAAVEPVVGDAAAFLDFLAGVARVSDLTFVFFAIGFFAPGLLVAVFLATDFLSVGLLVSGFFAASLFVRLLGSKAGGGVDTESTTTADGLEGNGRSSSMSRADVFFFECEVPEGGLIATIPAASCIAEDSTEDGVIGQVVD